MLTQDQINQYESCGYVFPDYRLSEPTLEEIREKHKEIIQKFPAYRDNCPDLLSYDPSFLKYAQNPIILDMVAQLIGPNIALWNMSFFAKPAYNGKKTPWHQDGQYWPIRPLATCTVWIAIDDATEENGCMQFIPGSHKKKKLMKHRQKNDDNLTLQQELQLDQIDMSKSINVELSAGQISLHDVFLAHGSKVNLSNKPRRGMTLRLMPTTSLYDRKFATKLFEERGDYNGALRKLFLLRGADINGNNQFSPLT